VYENGSNLYRLSTVDGVDIGAGTLPEDIVIRAGLPESSPPQAASNIDMAAIETRFRFIKTPSVVSTVFNIAEFYKMSIKMYLE
jgi:hypothetical protein